MEVKPAFAIFGTLLWLSVSAQQEQQHQYQQGLTLPLTRKTLTTWGGAEASSSSTSLQLDVSFASHSLLRGDTTTQKKRTSSCNKLFASTTSSLSRASWEEALWMLRDDAILKDVAKFWTVAPLNVFYATLAFEGNQVSQQGQCKRGWGLQMSYR